MLLLFSIGEVIKVQKDLAGYEGYTREKTHKPSSVLDIEAKGYILQTPVRQVRCRGAFV